MLGTAKQGMTLMRRVTTCVGLVSVLTLGACAVVPPQGPTVLAVPGQGRSPAEFQQDDFACRQFAFAQTGGVTSAQAGNNAAVGSAVLGTALGAGVGAALGSVGGAVGAGAAIGGATGLLAGSAIGAGNAQASAANMQQRFDMAYAQCMISRGNQVQSPPAFAGASPYWSPYGGYAWGGYPGWGGYPYWGYGPGWYGPTVAIGVGGGWGWGRGWGRGWDARGRGWDGRGRGWDGGRGGRGGRGDGGGRGGGGGGRGGGGSGGGRGGR